VQGAWVLGVWGPGAWDRAVWERVACPSTNTISTNSSPCHHRRCTWGVAWEVGWAVRCRLCPPALCPSSLRSVHFFVIFAYCSTFCRTLRDGFGHTGHATHSLSRSFAHAHIQCMYTHTNILTHMHTHPQTHTHANTRTHTDTCTTQNARTHTRKDARAPTDVQRHTNTHSRPHALAHSNTHAQIHTHHSTLTIRYNHLGIHNTFMSNENMKIQWVEHDVQRRFVGSLQ